MLPMSKLQERFAGRHALITGASVGIRAAIAARLVNLGAGLTQVTRRREPLNEAAQRLSRQRPGAAVRTLALDVADQASVNDMLPGELAAQPVDLVVNDAGVAHASRRWKPSQSGSAHCSTSMRWAPSGSPRSRATPSRPGPRPHRERAWQAVLEGIYGYSAYATAKFAVLRFLSGPPS